MMDGIRPGSSLLRSVRADRCAGKAGAEEWMKKPYDEGVANHIDPESCAGSRKARVKR